MIKPDPKIVEKIMAMSQVEMARLWRFDPIGSVYFNDTLPYFEIFSKRFNELGGMTSEVSKLIGFDCR